MAAGCEWEEYSNSFSVCLRHPDNLRVKNLYKASLAKPGTALVSSQQKAAGADFLFLSQHQRGLKRKLGQGVKP